METATPAPERKASALLVVAFAVAAYVRYTLGLQIGHEGDMLQWLEWADVGAHHPLGEIYLHTNANYSPAYMYVLWLLGKAQVAFPALTRPDYRYVLMKAPALLGDLVVGWLIYSMVARQFGRYTGNWVALLYLFNPAVISDSAYYGQTDGLVPLFPLIALHSLERKRWRPIGVWLALAMAIKIQPIVLVLPILAFVLADFGVWAAAATAGISIGSFFLIALPFVFTSGQLSRMLQKVFVDNLNAQAMVGLGAFNFWEVASPFSLNDDHPIVMLLGVPVTPKLIGLLLFVLAWTPAVLAGCAGRSLTGRSYALGMAAWSFFMFPTEIHERYLLPAVAFFAICAPRHLVAAVTFAVVSGIHLYSRHARFLGPVNPLLLLPFFLLAFFHMRVECTWEAETHRLAAIFGPQRWLVVCGRWLTGSLWLPTGVLAAAVVVAALAVSGWLHERAGELSLTRLGTYRSAVLAYDGNVEGGPLRVAGEEFSRGIQVRLEQPLTVRFPPVFGMLRTGVGFQAGQELRCGAGCSALVSVTSPQSLPRISTRVTPGSSVQRIDVPLSHQHTELTFVASGNGCDCDARIDWTDPRLVSWERLNAEPGRDIIYLSDMREHSLWPAPSFGPQGKWVRDRSVEGRALSIGGHAYTKGLGTHADSVLRFRVPDGFSTFVTDLGYDDEIPPGGTRMQFIIVVDGREVYRSPEVEPRHRTADLRIPVRGARQIALIVDARGFSDGDHADWGAARFIRDDAPKAE